MTDIINVLDHGHVRLVDHMGSDLSISRSARVSHDAEGRPDDAKLIRYLYKNRHNTPFESVTFTFDVKAPIFVFRQWHRHRTQSYNELSARYRELPEEFYVPKPHLLGVQNADNKQMRDVVSADEFLELPEIHQTVARSTCVHMRKANEASFRAYQSMLIDGVPRELARSVLPVATYSHMFTTMNLHNLFHFLGLRLHEHAQYEIRVYAEAMLGLIEPIVPVAVGAFRDGLAAET